METKLEQYGEKLQRMNGMMTYAVVMFLAANEIRDLKRELSESSNKKVPNVVRPVSAN